MSACSISFVCRVPELSPSRSSPDQHGDGRGRGRGRGRGSSRGSPPEQLSPIPTSSGSEQQSIRGGKGGGRGRDRGRGNKGKGRVLFSPELVSPDECNQTNQLNSPDDTQGTQLLGKDPTMRTQAPQAPALSLLWEEGDHMRDAEWASSIGHVYVYDDGSGFYKYKGLVDGQLMGVISMLDNSKSSRTVLSEDQETLARVLIAQHFAIDLVQLFELPDTDARFRLVVEKVCTHEDRCVSFY